MPTTTRPLGSASPHARRERSGGGVPPRPSLSWNPQATDQRAGGTWRLRGTGHLRVPTGCCRQVGAAAVGSGDCGGRLAQVSAASARPARPVPSTATAASALPAPLTWPGRSGVWAAGVLPCLPPFEPPCPLDRGGGRAPLPWVRAPGASPPAALPPAQDPTTSHALMRHTRPRGWRRETPEGVAPSQRRVAVGEGSRAAGSAVWAGRHGVGWGGRAWGWLCQTLKRKENEVNRLAPGSAPDLVTLDGSPLAASPSPPAASPSPTSP